MALQHLTDEQVRTWTLEEKDRWWLTNVFKGDMPQLTIRAAITAFCLGRLLSATNLYVGAKTGWTLGVGLTSVILAFAMFKVFASLGQNAVTRGILALLVLAVFGVMAMGARAALMSASDGTASSWSWFVLALI